MAVEGLPGGAITNLTLTGPGGSRSLTGPGTIGNLAPGSYTLTAADASHDGDGYQAISATQAVTIRSSAATDAQVSYLIATGRLAVTIVGLPDGPADVQVSGPGVTRIVTTAETLKGLAPGSYTVTPRPVVLDGERFASPVEPAVVSVTAGAVAMPVAVEYQLASGRLQLSILDVPAGATPAITIDGPDGFSATVASSQLFKGLAPGQYQLTGNDLLVAGDKYAALLVPKILDVVAGSTPTVAIASYRIATGALTVNVLGLPNGAAGKVTVTGPGGFSRNLSTTETLRGLEPGSYSIGATSVGSAVVYLPSPASQSVTVVADAEPAVRTVTYTQGVGSLTLTVAGAPGGAGNVTITGPNGFNRTVTGSTALTGLVPGAYTVAAAAITVAGHGYQPTPASQGAAVSVGGIAAVSVTYAIATGSIDVAVAGLPGGAAAAVSVTGPGGFSQNVTGSVVIPGLAPGSYTVAAAAVSAGGQTYNATPPSRSVTVAAGATAAAGVSYAVAVSGGALTIDISGLPGGVAGSVTIIGPGGSSSQVITATQTLTGLPAGMYFIEASSVSSGGTTYNPAPVSQTATVTAGATATRSVSYTAVVSGGNLTINISGLPGGTAANVSVTGPGGFNRTVTATETLTGLAAGSYNVAATNVWVAGPISYRGTPSFQSASVTTGATATANVAYVATGNLAITVTGLPPGTNAAVSLSGPGGYSANLTGSLTFNSLTPGTYTIAAASVLSGGDPYNPSPASQNIVVTGGVVTPAAVAYSLGSVATLNLTIDGMYLTQAIAKYDGTTPLVAGRDAYLRIFVKANQANPAAPAVRVRFYSGASLIQTSTINAPAASVPTAITEGTLASSWNLAVPGALVQPNLRILADVDPTDVVTEANETDNTFPTTGTPFAIDVRTVPTWNIRLVPILQQANGLQGDVTAGNAGQFLSEPLKLLPVAAYNADVRAPYTTTAPAIQAGDANGAWGTILLEMLTLRSIDGSNWYYYGVVKPGYASGVAGMGYVGGGFLASIGWDFLHSASGVMAHEIGHNMGLDHSPCGVAAGPDPAYPYAGGSIGAYGLDLATLTVKAPGTHFDFMAYCNPSWVSDYTWAKAIAHRQSNPTYAPPAAVTTAAAGLLVWGRITGAGVVLEPALRVAPPSMAPTGSGAYRVEGLAADGRVLFSYPVDPQRAMVTGQERQELHFSTVVPLNQAQDEALARLRLVTPTGPIERRSAQAMAGTGPHLFFREPGMAVSAPSAAQARLTWDAATYPMALVRDAATGEILSFARGGAATLWTKSRRFDVTFSDGVRSVVRQVR